MTQAAGADLDAVRNLVDAARLRVQSVPQFECRLTKREVVNGRSLPQDEVVYRLRTTPFSVYMRVLSEAGQGREVLYVAGANGGKMAVVTGKGDNAIVGAGYRTDIDPTSKAAASKSRYRITDAGFTRTLDGLAKALAAAEGGRAGGVRSLGSVTRPESAKPFVGVEVAIPKWSDPLLPGGGTRRVYFDQDESGPGYRLPVLVETIDAAGREVEYYHFHHLVAPADIPASAWDPAKLGKSAG